MPEELPDLCKRTWAAIDELGACVEEQEVEEDEDEAFHTRVHTVAMTMLGLGLGLGNLGELALCLAELEKICEECDKEAEAKAAADEGEPDVLDAEVIG